MHTSNFEAWEQPSIRYIPINDFEVKIVDLWKVPEKDWFNGRLYAVSRIIGTTSEIQNIRSLELPGEHDTIYKLLKFDYQTQTYLLFTDITRSSSGSITNCFHLERQDKSLGENIIRTFLILSSDNNAKALGSVFFSLL